MTKRRMVLEIGMGTDIRGVDPTKRYRQNPGAQGGQKLDAD
jgi:hypothetical protein